MMKCRNCQQETDVSSEHTNVECIANLRARVENLEGWLSILWRAPSDYGKLIHVLVPKALRGEKSNIERILVEADIIRCTRNPKAEAV